MGTVVGKTKKKLDGRKDDQDNHILGNLDIDLEVVRSKKFQNKQHSYQR